MLLLFLTAADTGTAPPPAPNPDHHQLIQEARAGSREAFDEIVFLYRDQVYGAAWNLTRNMEDALDVTQETFLRAWRALSSYRGRSRFSTWLHRITLNTAIDYIRREKKHRHLSSNDPETAADPRARQTLQGAAEAPQRHLIQHQQIQRRIRAELSKLSPRQRQVFILRHYHDLELPEAAEIMKCSHGAAKRHLFRAQMRLKELLKDIER